MSNALEVLKRIVREEYKNIKDGVNIHQSGFRDYTPEEDSDFDEPHSTEKMESIKEDILSENPAASAAAAMVMMQMQNPDTGKKIKAITPLKDKDHKLHGKAKGIFKRLKDKFTKKDDKPVDKVAQYRALMQKQQDFRRESVNESTKRQYRNVYSKYYKTYEAFAREVMNLAKRVTKISGDRTDERVILKNFKKQVIPFAGLMRSWSRGRESNPHIDESVNEGDASPNKGDYVKTIAGMAQIEKIRGSIAYMKLPGKKTKGYWMNDLKNLKPTDKKEKGKTLWTESVNKECCDNCKEGKTCCSVTEGKTMKITKTRIKEIIREEIKSVLTEGTRWLVGIEAPSGKIASTYGHYDGYPEHAGKMLKKYYNNTGKVKQLMKLGKQGISTIDKSMKGGKDHSFNNTKKGETVFYGRDRGQKGSMSSTWGNRDKVKFSSGEEFAYIWSAKDKKWYYKSRYSNPQDWAELK